MAEKLELHDHVRLASGKEFNCGYLATVPQGLMFISITTDNPAEIVQYFTQTSETSKITYGDHILKNYVFMSFHKEEENRYKVALRRAFAGEI